MKGSDDSPNGMLIGGADNGNVLIWNVNKIIRYACYTVDYEVGSYSGTCNRIPITASL